MRYKMLEITTRHAPDKNMGSLSVVEANRDIPFEIKRIYYISGTKKDIQRGFHGHKALKQLLVCMHGKIRIDMDDGLNRESVVLDDPSKGLLMEPGIWRVMEWLEDDSLLLSSDETLDSGSLLADEETLDSGGSDTDSIADDTEGIEITTSMAEEEDESDD